MHRNPHFSSIRTDARLFRAAVARKGRRGSTSKNIFTAAEATPFPQCSRASQYPT
jgi:hypothetical protein